MTGFPEALISGDYTNLRGGNSGQAFLAYNPQDTVFAARVNQSSFDDTFATVTFDTVTVGSISAALEGYTVFFSSTDSKANAYHVGRVRQTAGSGNTLYIEQTSAAIADNDYIFACRDIRIWSKQPRLIGIDYMKDYAIEFRRLLPLIQGLPTAAATVDSGAWAFSFAPSGLAVESGATISSWAWFADGGTFTSGSPSSQNVTIEYSAPGVYLPRVTVTDSNGNTNWFAVQCFAVPDDFSGVVLLDTKDYQIGGNADTGFSANVTGWRGLDLLDNTFMVIFRITGTDINGNIRFIGRTRSFSAPTDIDEKRGLVATNALQLEGIGGQLGNTRTWRMGFTNVASPTRFDEINDLTWWRASAYLVTEHSTVANVCAVSFSDTGTTYEFIAYSSQKSSLADSLNSIGFTVKACLNYAADGAIHMAREANYLPSAARNALTTVANWTSADYLSYTLSKELQKSTGQVQSFGGVYDTSGGGETIYKAITPAVTATPAQGDGELNRQVLAANASFPDATAELGQRVSNDLAAKNPTLTLHVKHPAGYDFITPCRFQWYTWTLPGITNAAGITLTTAQRFLCTEISYSYDHETASLVNEATYQLETTSTGYQVIAGLAPIDQAMSLPSLPPLDPYPTFPAETGIFLPDGSTDEEDEQPVSNDQAAVVNSPLSPRAAMLKNNQPTNYSIVFNFVLADGAWYVFNNGVTIPGGDYLLGTGWFSTFNGDAEDDLTIARDFTGTFAANMTVQISYVLTATFTIAKLSLYNGTTEVDSETLTNVAGSYVQSKSLSGTADKLALQFTRTITDTTYDTDSAEAVLISGSWVPDTPMQFARANSSGALAEFDIVFAQPVTLVEFTYQSQTLSVSGFTQNIGSCELWLGGSLIATVFSFNRPADGGYVWSSNPSVNAIASTVGAGTVFDTMKFKHQHMGNRIADVRGEVTVYAGGGALVGSVSVTGSGEFPF